MKNSAAAESSAATSHTVLETHKVSDPQKAATWFSTMLAADKGVPSRLVKIGRRTVDVVADDDRAVRFEFAPQVVR